ncbi:MAG: shikimate dehydrogenase family protein [bacterium]
MKRLGVIGQPISHSRSPAMQNAALEALGMSDEWIYDAIEVSAEEFPSRVAELPGLDYVGVNVTIPHKTLALEVADEVSPAVEAIGASNTLIFSGGSVQAENTDAAGVLEATPVAARTGRTLVLGAGGVSRAAVWALSGAGSEVYVWNRNTERAEDLVSSLAVDGPAPEVISSRDARSGSFDLTINCTAVGMPGRDDDPFEVLPFNREALVGSVVLVLV